jgi:hypothetical protein
MSPFFAASNARISAGSNRSEWLTPSFRPVSRDFASIASQSAAVSAIGFSTSTWQPISIAAIASVACEAGGVST